MDIDTREADEESLTQFSPLMNALAVATARPPMASSPTINDAIAGGVQSVCSKG